MRQPNDSLSHSAAATASSTIESSVISSERPDESPVPRKSILSTIRPGARSRAISTSARSDDFLSSARGDRSTIPFPSSTAASVCRRRPYR